MSSNEAAGGVLTRAALFAGLDEGILAELAEQAKPVSLQAGQRIFNLGEEARTVLLIVSGTVALKLPLVLRGESKDVTIDEKGEGAALAWSALVPPNKFTLSATAQTDVELLGIEREALGALFEREPRAHAQVMSNLSQVIGSRVAMLEALLIRDLQRWVTEK